MEFRFNKHFKNILIYFTDKTINKYKTVVLNCNNIEVSSMTALDEHHYRYI